jgi:hypothetical protein
MWRTRLLVTVSVWFDAAFDDAGIRIKVGCFETLAGWRIRGETLTVESLTYDRGLDMMLFKETMYTMYGVKVVIGISWKRHVEHQSFIKKDGIMPGSGAIIAAVNARDRDDCPLLARFQVLFRQVPESSLFKRKQCERGNMMIRETRKRIV